MVNFTRQPTKGIYAIVAICFELVRFPVFLAKFLLGSGRQNPAWTFRQAISVRILSSALWHIATLQLGTPLPLTPGAEKERFLVIKPAKSDVYKGPLKSNKDVVPVDIGATWYPAPLTAGSDKSRIKVILHTHGGAFVHGDGRTVATGYLTKTLLRNTSATHVLCPQYRLSTLPASPTSNPFPAALQDVLTSYLYLLNDLKIPAKNIILSGDSAGGNLTIALLRYIAEYGTQVDLPAPSGALLWSPWIDPSDTSCSYVHDNKNYATDYLSPPFTSWGTSAYAGQAGEKVLSEPYVTQKYQMFKSPAPMFVNVGGCEVLYFSVVEWANKMKEAGNDIVLDIDEHAPHDILALGAILGFQKDAESMAKKAGEWMKEH